MIKPLMALSWLEADASKSENYAERYVNNFLSMGYTTYECIPLRYWPQAKDEIFTIKAYKVPLSELRIFTADPDEKLLDYFVNRTKGYARLFVHPAIDEDRRDQFQQPIAYFDIIDKNEADEHKVSPSSSVRTLFIKDDHLGGCRYWVKCHFPHKLTPFYIKTFGPQTIAHSVAMSRYLKDYVHPNFAILPESIGISFPTVYNADGTMRKKGWGLSVRETRPYPPAVIRPVGKWTLLPLFSLYSKDIYNPEKEIILKTIYDHYKLKGGNECIVDFVFSKFIRQHLEVWVGCIRKTGIILERHAQNCVFEIDDDMNIGRLVDRDLEMFVDVEIRKSLGLSFNDIHPESCLYDEKKEYYSQIYDEEMSMIFDELAAFFNSEYDCENYHPGEELAEKVRNYLGELMPDHENFFPETTRVLSTDLSSFNVHKFKDTGKLPIWRPHIKKLY